MMKRILIYSILFLFLTVGTANAVVSNSALVGEDAAQKLQDKKALVLEKRENIASKVVEVKENIKKKVTGTLQERARREIKRRVVALNKILERIAKIKRLSDTQEKSLNTQVQSEIQKLTNLDAKIVAETYAAAIKEDAQSIIKSYKIYAFFIPNIHILGASDGMQNAAAKLDEIAVRFETKIIEAKGAGKDVTSLEKLLLDMKEKTASASSHAEQASSLVTPLTPEGYPDNKVTLKEAREILVLGYKDIQVAREDAVQILTKLKEFNIDTSSGTSSATSTK